MSAFRVPALTAAGIESDALDETAPDLRTTYRHFSDGSAQQWDDAGTYACEGTITRTRTCE